MPIIESEVVVGGIYALSNNQERRVTTIENGKVRYEVRADTKNRWTRGSPMANPPKLKTFAKACSHTAAKP
jgi:hypothetical protein